MTDRQELTATFQCAGRNRATSDLCRHPPHAGDVRDQINTTDCNDARSMAQMMRAGLYRPVHAKTLRSQKLRMLLTHRELLPSKYVAVENDMRAALRNFGLTVGMVGTATLVARIKELVEDLPDLAVLVKKSFRLVLVSHDGLALVPIPERSTRPWATSTLQMRGSESA